jgi:hypothetical protein
MYQTTNTRHTIYKHDLRKKEDSPALVLYVTSPIAYNTSDTRNRSRVSACPNCTSYSSFFTYSYTISLSTLIHTYTHLYLHLPSTYYQLNILITVRSFLHNLTFTQSLLGYVRIQQPSTATSHTTTGTCTVNRVISNYKFSIFKKIVQHKLI